MDRDSSNNIIDKTPKERLIWVDSLKGVIILLVVLGHVIGGIYNSQMFSSYNSEMLILYNAIYMFHMPVFFIISGICFQIAYTYENKDGKIYLKNRNIKVQIYNLLYVYLVWSLLSWVLKMFVPGQVNSQANVKEILFIPVMALFQYWYLYVLIVCYLISMVLNKIFHRVYIGILCICFLVSILTALFFKDELTIIKAFEYYFFFYIGTCYFKVEKYLIENKAILAIGGSITVLLNIVIVFNQIKFVNWTAYGMLGIMTALSDCFFIINLAKVFLEKSSVFNYIGRNSMEIYVIHFLITSFNRVWLRRIDTGFYLYIIINWTLGVVIPIIVSYVLKKIKLYESVFKPVKIKRSSI